MIRLYHWTRHNYQLVIGSYTCRINTSGTGSFGYNIEDYGYGTRWYRWLRRWYSGWHRWNEDNDGYSSFDFPRR